jgi:protein-disulfide isomerase
MSTRASTVRVVVTAISLAAAAWPRAGIAQDATLDGLGHDLGDPEAPVLVVEYGDFACSACAQFALNTWPTLRSEFVQTGRVRWKLVPFDLGFRNSEEGARAAECAADQDLFWEMHDVLFEHRDRWVDERNPKDELVALAGMVGAEDARFLRCYEEDTFEDRTEAANDAAKDAGVRGTPTFFVNGFQVQGALPADAFRPILVDAQPQP